MIPALLLGLALAGDGGYARRCAGCHGDQGGGDGPAAPFLDPRPRVFTDCAFKLRSTPSGELPTDDDLLAVITRGLPGTAMPAFGALPEAERRELVATLRSFCADFEDPSFVGAAVPMPELAAPPPTAPDVVAGRRLYTEAGCDKCHGAKGRGDGPSWATKTDDHGDRALPANLTLPDRFRAGADADAIFRVLSTGLNGTPMPSYADSLTAEERWDLAHYVTTLAEPSAGGDRVVARRVRRAPTTPHDPLWDGAPALAAATFPNLIEPPRSYWPAVPVVRVQALYDDRDLALRITWDDRARSAGTDAEGAYADRDGALHVGTDHPDQLALQLPSRHDDAARPYLFFGDSRRAVDLWWWRADTDTVTRHAARGWGRMRDVGPGPAHALTFEDGRYTLVFTRSRGDDFPAGRWVPFVVHVWDGEAGEAGRRHALTRWRWLVLEPETPASAYWAPILAGLATALGWLGLVRRVQRGQGSRASGADSEASPTST